MATEDDYAKALRVAEYIVGCCDKHGLILSPKSLQVVAKSDASYAEHEDGRSHTGGCIGVESDYACEILCTMHWALCLCLSQYLIDLVHSDCVRMCVGSWRKPGSVTVV